MDGTIAILGFWLFMIVLILKKPLTTFLERAKPTSDKQTELKLQNQELLLQSIAKDLGEIKLLLQAQNAGTDLLQLKSALAEIGTNNGDASDETESSDDADADEDANADDDVDEDD